MKHKLSFFAILLMALALPQSVRAYDFSAVAPSGQTLYYDIVDGEAWVTSQYTASLPTYLNLTGDLTIPSSVTYGGTTYSVTSINNYAFQGCSDLTSATIPNSVTSIGYRAFEDCSGLTSITVDSDNPVYDSRNNCNAIIVTATNILLFGCKNTIIPTSVTSIENYAFSGCSGLTSLTIPNSVTRIENYAFSGCSGLTSLTIPSSVTSIENYAFSGCSGLDSITVANGNPTYDSRNNCNAIIKTATNTLIAGCKNTIIPTSVTSIGEGAFFGYSGLTSVTIPNSVTEIHYSAFEDCSGLTSLTIPNSVTSIGYYAFSGCSSLTSITIPSLVTWIGSSAFSGCSGLTSITVDSDNPVYDSRNNCNAIIETATNTLIAGCKNTIIPNSVTSIDDEAFYGCSGLISVTIPNSVTSISYRVFCHCSGLASVTIPNSVTSISNYAFEGCSGLTSVTIPNSVTEIHYSAFEDCSGLTSLTIGNSVTDIGPWAFYNCTNLAEVTCLATTPPSLGGDVFYGIASPCTLTVPCGTEQAYQASGWGTDFSTIQCDEVGIGDVDAAGIAVYAADGRIVVRGAAGLEVRVFDAVGHEVVLSADRGETPLLPTGVYLVKVGTLPAKKVVVTR